MAGWIVQGGTEAWLILDFGFWIADFGLGAGIGNERLRREFRPRHAPPLSKGGATEAADR